MIGYTLFNVIEPCPHGVELQVKVAAALYKTLTTNDMNPSTKDRVWSMLTTRGNDELIFGSRPSGKDTAS